MKIALYVEDGLEQIVLTPESETERGIVSKLRAEDRELSIKRGSFYGCQGGWVRHKQPSTVWYTSTDDDSTMIVLRRKEPPAQRAAAGGGEQNETTAALDNPESNHTGGQAIAEARREI